MDVDELLAKLTRMEGYHSRGIQCEVSERNIAPVVLIQVTNPEDSALVPEITELALEIYHATESLTSND